MIELKLYVSEVDYESVIRALSGGGFAGGAAVMAAKALSESAKEEMAVKYLNGSAEKLEKMLENAAAEQGMSMKITGAQASVVEPS